MFELQTYKLIHDTGLMMLFLSLGALTLHAVNGGTKESNKIRSLTAASHGIALLLILVGGFGALARMGIQGSFPTWVILKIIVWLMMGGAIVAIRKQAQHARLIWFALILLGVCAGYLGLFKP